MQKKNMSVFPMKPLFSHFFISFLLLIPPSPLPDQETRKSLSKILPKYLIFVIEAAIYLQTLKVNLVTKEGVYTFVIFTNFHFPAKAAKLLKLHHPASQNLEQYQGFRKK